MSFTNPYPASRLTVDTANSLANGLVGFWALTDGSGSFAKDISTGANDGTLGTGVTWSAGNLGTNAEFPSTAAGRIDTGLDMAGASAVTVSAWVRNDGGSIGDSYGKIVTQSHGPNFDTTMNKNGTALTFFINSTTVVANNADIPSIGTWFHVCFVWEQSVTQAIYINGNLSNSGTADTSVIGATTHNVFIGGTSAATRPWDGGIQNVRIYNRALSATEVATLYNRPWEGTNYGTLWPYSPPAPADATLSTDTAATSLMSGCQAWWLLTDGSGSTATDIVGTNDGTITNVDWLNSEVGMSSDFQTEATGDHITTGFSAAGQSEITVSLWMRNDGGSTPNGYGRLLSMGFLNSLDCYIKKDSNQALSFVINNSVASTNSPPPIGEWYHFCGVWSQSSRQELYINGSLITTATPNTSVIASGSHNVFIGGTTDGPRTFHGGIQNVRIWDRALSSDEVAILAERPFEGLTYGDAFHYDPPTPANLTPLDNSSGIMTDCVGWWPLTETNDYASGAADISGSAATFTKAGSVTSDVSSLGTTALFDGVNGTYLRGGTSLLASPSAMTVSAWVNLEAYSSVAGHGIVSRWGSGSTSNQFLLYYPASGTGVRFFVTDGSTNYIAQSTRVPTDFLNRYVHFVGTWDGTDVKLYIDGVEDATIAGPSSINSGGTDNIRIGNYVNDTHPMDGNVANVRIWSRALTADEVWSIYANPWLGSAYQASAAAVYYNYILRSKRFRRLS